MKESEIKFNMFSPNTKENPNKDSFLLRGEFSMVEEFGIDHNFRFDPSVINEAKSRIRTLLKRRVHASVLDRRNELYSLISFVIKNTHPTCASDCQIEEALKPLRELIKEALD